MNYTARPIEETRIFVAEDEPITTPDAIYERLKDSIDAEQEHVFLITLNASFRVIKIHDIFKGTVNNSVMHPRDIFREAVRDNAAAIMIAHNHPSGNLTPSLEDAKTTKDISAASKILGIQLLDHLIITKTHGYFSFAGNGIL